MCACKMFHGPGTRRAVCSSIHVNIESKQSATLTLCGMGGALVALTFHYGVVISLDFLLKKRRISYYSLHVLDCLDTVPCHLHHWRDAAVASPRYRPSYAPRLPPSAATLLSLSFTSPSLVFTLHSSTTGHWCTPTTIETLATRFAAR